VEQSGTDSHLNFSQPSYVSIDCLVKKNYHSMLYGVAAAASLLMSAISLQVLWAEVRKIVSMLRSHSTGTSSSTSPGPSAGEEVEAEKEEVVSKYFSSCLVLSYLIYPSCTAVFSQTFNCREINGVITDCVHVRACVNRRCDHPHCR
jgi:hypothetical protein